MATKYLVLNADSEQVAEKSDKKAAIKIAVEQREATRKTHRVVTSAGTEVHVEKGVRAMKRTPRYTRTVELPEGFKLPEGARPAYLRKRHDSVIVAMHDDEGVSYDVYRLSSQERIGSGFALTREAGAFVLTVEKLEAEAEPVEA